MGMMSLVDAEGVVHAIEDWELGYSRNVAPLTARPMRGGDRSALEARDDAKAGRVRIERYAFEDDAGVVRKIEMWDGVSKHNFGDLKPRRAKKGDAIVSRDLPEPDDVAPERERPKRAPAPGSQIVLDGLAYRVAQGDAQKFTAAVWLVLKGESVDLVLDSGQSLTLTPDNIDGVMDQLGGSALKPRGKKQG